MTQFSEIHEEVFEYLIKYHKENSDFLFTLRQINRGGRLDKGYWFLGNDKYLLVSFWTGKDHLTKTPRIYFKINNDGTSSMELSDQDTDYFPEPLLEKLKAVPQNPYYDTKNYISSLEYFLNHEKILIDNYINLLSSSIEIYDSDDYVRYLFLEPEYTSAMEFLTSYNFKTQLDKINSYRKGRSGSYSYLESLYIENFAAIKKTSIENIPINNRWIFLTGENGAGKSTILKAIAVGLCQNNDNNEIIATPEQFGEFHINLKLQNINSVHSISFNDHYKNKNCLVNSFSAYGPVRLLSEGTIDQDLFVKEIEKISKKITYGLFNPIGLLRDLSDPYALFCKPKYQELFKIDLIAQLSEIIPNYDADIDDDNQIYFQSNSLNSNPKGLKIDQLPSGTRSLVSLILDILVRFQHFNPKETDISNYSGIVLIDEIDIHLHPNMQKWLINQLNETFPKIQFIVSSHSPVTLLCAPENSLIYNVKNSLDDGIKLQRLDDKIYIDELLPNTILSSPIFGMDDIFPANYTGNKPASLDNNYTEIMMNNHIDEQIDNFLTNKKEKEIIARIKKRLK